MDVRVNRARAIGAAGALVFGLLVPLASTLAQQDVWVPDIPLTHESGTHARALGMGGAYLAISDDAGALRFNPAGLARVARLEFSGSLTDLSREIETGFDGVAVKSSLGRTHVTSLGFVYPFPTYRGSMVIGLAYNAPWLLDREYSRRNYTGAADEGWVREDIFEEGQVGEWSFAYAVDASPTLSLGLRASWIHGSRMQDWVYQDEVFDIHDVLDVDMNGFTGSLGAQSRIGNWGRAGLTIDLPRWIWVEGTLEDALADGAVWTIDESMTLPFRAGLGAAATVQKLLVTADARFTDWTQIDYQGPMRYYDGDTRRLAYRRTWDLHAGAEYLLDFVPSLGLRLRGGVAWEPVPYKVVLEEVRAVPAGEDEVIAEPIYREADFDPDRLTFTAGLGVLLQQSLTVDLAYASGSFQRKGERLTEEERERRLLITASFRLE